MTILTRGSPRSFRRQLCHETCPHPSNRHEEQHMWGREWAWRREDTAGDQPLSAFPSSPIAEWEGIHQQLIKLVPSGHLFFRGSSHFHCRRKWKWTHSWEAYATLFMNPIVYALKGLFIVNSVWGESCQILRTITVYFGLFRGFGSHSIDSQKS